MRKLLLIAMCFAVAIMFSGIAYGFHDEGVARCSGCHTMHNSQNGSTGRYASSDRQWVLADQGHPQLTSACPAMVPSAALYSAPIL